MKKYFLLQYKMTNRKLIDFGISPLLGYLLLLAIFIVFSNLIFSKMEFANYFYIFIALNLILKLNAPKRNHFLLSIFSKKDYLKLRIFENLIYSSPFIIFLIYKGLHLYSLIIFILSIFLVFFYFNTKINFIIPTPFSKKPFEFTTGFRKTFFVFPMAYFLTFISVSVTNFNLGIFSLILVGLVCFSFYSNPENKYFVWNFSLSSKEFLLKKIKTGCIHFTYLSSPIVITLSLFFYKNIDIILVFFILCYVYLITIILVKYSTYPHKMNLPQGFLITISFIFPPALIGIIPFLYLQSLKKLKNLLDD